MKWRKRAHLFLPTMKFLYSPLESSGRFVSRPPPRRLHDRIDEANSWIPSPRRGRGPCASFTCHFERRREATPTSWPRQIPLLLILPVPDIISRFLNNNMNERKRPAPMLRRTWFTVISLCGASLMLSSPRLSSMAAATADDATPTSSTMHDRQQHESHQRRRRRRGERRSLVGCATPYSGGTDYEAGDIVSRKGKMYQCRPHPYSLWCSNGSYAPGGATGYWSEAWIVSIVVSELLYYL